MDVIAVPVVRSLSLAFSSDFFDVTMAVVVAKSKVVAKSNWPVRIIAGDRLSLKMDSLLIGSRFGLNLVS